LWPPAFLGRLVKTARTPTDNGLDGPVDSDTLIHATRRVPTTRMSTETPDPTETEAFEQVCQELVDRILAGEIGRDDIESAKLSVCSEYSAPKVPKNSELLDFAPQDHREELEEVLRRKPVRTASASRQSPS
jgi:Histone acetyltransferase